MTGTQHPSDGPVSGATHGSRERASCWLAESTLSFDLSDEVRQLNEEAGWQQSGRAGKPVFEDLPLVPVACPHRGTAGFHYGNNIRLAPTGRYDVTVRVAPGPLVGADPAPGASRWTSNRRPVAPAVPWRV